MLKNPLKISVVILGLLALAAAKDRVSAMEKEDPETSSIASKLNDPDSENTQNNKRKESPIPSPGQIFPNELLLHTFSFLDYKNEINAGKVCHLWHSLIQISLSMEDAYTGGLFTHSYKDKKFDSALSFLEKFHSNNSKPWKRYVYNLLYTLPYANKVNETLQDPEIDSDSIKNLIVKFRGFFPAERKNENIYNLSLAQFPQYKNVFCFLNQPIDDSQFSRGMNYLTSSFPKDAEAWKIFSNYLHEFWCEYDTLGKLVRVQKDIIPSDRIKAFLRLFSEKFPKEQDHLSIISLSTAVEFMKEEQKKPQPK